MVAQASPVTGGEDANWNADQHDHRCRGDDEFERSRQILRDVLPDRPVAVERVSEVAMRHLAHVFPILYRDRLVEMPLVAQSLNLRLGRVWAESDPGRIAWNQAGD